MAEGTRIEDVVRRAIDANLKYYEGLGRLTVDYVSALAEVVSGSKLPIRLGRKAEPSKSTAASGPTAAAQRIPALLLEGGTGTEAQAMFVVNNDLPREVTATVATSGFLDASGNEVHPTLVTDPGVVSLGPGERTAVRILATITEDLEPEVAYRGEITVPGLSERGVPVILRRAGGARGPATGVPAGAEEQEASKKPKAGKAATRKAATRKAAAGKAPRKAAAKKPTARKTATKKAASGKAAAPKGEGSARKSTAARKKSATRKAAPKKSTGRKKST